MSGWNNVKPPMVARFLIAATSLLLFGSASFAADTYEAWYDTTMAVPGQPVQKGKLHTYFDGKQQFSLQEDEAGNKSGTTFEIPFDSTTLEYMKLAKATSLSPKAIDGKKCTGWSYFDQMMHRPSVNWLDDTGHLYYQEIDKYTGTEGKWQQKRTDLKINPKTSDLVNNPACKP